MNADYGIEISIAPKLSPESSIRSATVSLLNAIEIIWKNADKRSVFTPTPLDEYVWREDNTYNWTLLADATSEDEYTHQYVLNVTSQKWLDESWMDRSVWWHFVVVIVYKGQNKFCD